MAQRTATTGPTDDRVSPAGERLPMVLPWVVLALTLAAVLGSLGGLLQQVQVAGAASGGIESLASGLSPSVIPDTQALLLTWFESVDSHRLISWTARAYTGVDLLYLAALVILLIQCWRRLQRHQPAHRPQPDGSPAAPVNLTVLQDIAHSPNAWLVLAGAAAADVAEDTLRLVLVERTLANLSVPDLLVVAAWVANIAKFALFAAFLTLLAVLLVDCGQARTWLRRTLWALWRLRMAVAMSAVFVALLLADVTGQAIDLTRRWVDDWTAVAGGGLAFVGSLLLGATIWLVARRVVLADQSHDADKRVRWWAWLIVVAVGTGLLAWWLNLMELRAVSLVAAAILVLGLFWGRPADKDTMVATASERRAKDIEPPEDEKLFAARRAVRVVAIAPPVTLFMLAAVAYAPVPLVLGLNGLARSPIAVRAWLIIVVAIPGAALVALGGYGLLRRLDGPNVDPPPTLERWYREGALIVVVLAAAAFIGAVTHSPIVNVFLVVPLFLAALLFMLGEAQRWSERHTVPSGLLLLGFTRVPVATLLIVDLLVASFWLNDGSASAVRRAGALPGSMVSPAGLRTGIDLTAAFAAWRDGNCAGGGHAGIDVPLVLVAAPGGGLRAAYWTASTLTDLFGASRTAKVPGCDAAPADRIFAMGGASGGSLGLLAYAAGLDQPAGAPPRSATWFQEQLGRPDFLTDPLATMMTTDLARAYVGFGGRDRAQRLEDLWSAHMTYLGADFFADTWGLGGRRPVALLTGTQVESGCRLNVGPVRLTDAEAHVNGAGCAAVHEGAAQSDAPVTTDLLDLLCGPNDSATAMSLTNASAALLSARFPYISPSGQLYGCADDPEQARPSSIVDGGYADNTGIGMLLALWQRLEPLVATHNATAGNARVVPVFLVIDSHYAQVAAAAEPRRVVEALVPPLTRGRPDELDDLAVEAQAAAMFAATVPVPGSGLTCNVTLDNGRFVSLRPRTSPGLPAPLAWTLSRLSTDDLDAQRSNLLGADPAGAIKPAKAISLWASSVVTC